MNINLYQIIYDQVSLSQRDRNYPFINNLQNSRPDWYEYWPIRNFLLLESLNERDFYGFFSPKFKEKTGLTFSECCAFVRSLESSDLPDVIAFSPYFDQAAFFKNIFEQALPNHPGMSEVNVRLLEFLDTEIKEDSLMPPHEFIFCNFFIARRGFWKEWFKIAEKIFLEAESGSSEFGVLLTRELSHGTRTVQAKVFVIERLASLLLAEDRGYKAISYPTTQLPRCNSVFSSDNELLINLAALKIAAKVTRDSSYITMFDSVRASFLSRHELVVSFP